MNARQHIRQTQKMTAKSFMPMVRPLAVPDATETELLPVGSAVLIWHRGSHYIVSAAHVVEMYPECTYYIGTNNHWVEIEGPFHVSAAPNGNREEDVYDFAFQHVDADFASRLDGCAFLTADQISTDDTLEFTAPFRSKYMALGYPLNQFKLRRGGKTTATPALSYIGAIAPLSDYQRVKLHPATHIVTEFDYKSVVGPAGVQQAPKFEGLSGGGQFRLHSLENPGNITIPKLAAITVEQRRLERLMVGVRIDVILTAIDKLRQKT
jgi:hypothetical protein